TVVFLPVKLNQAPQPPVPYSGSQSQSNSTQPLSPPSLCVGVSVCVCVGVCAMRRYLAAPHTQLNTPRMGVGSGTALSVILECAEYRCARVCVCVCVCM